MSIYVDNLVKYYRVHHKEAGLRGSLRSLFRRQYETVKAVDGISFDIEESEIVGFLGPNGAGKTTTLKCLMDAIVMGLLETGRFPINFYRGWIRAALTVIVPVAFMTTFPAQALLGRLEWWLAIVAVGLAAILFVLASAFWRFALRYYTGASS